MRSSCPGGGRELAPLPWGQETSLDAGRRVVLSIADSFPRKIATQEAVATVGKTISTDFQVLLESHRDWWNLNIETLYLPVYTGNQLELGESFTNFIDAKRTNFYRNAKDIWGFDGCATVSHTTCYEGLRGDGSAAPDKSGQREAD